MSNLIKLGEVGDEYPLGPKCHHDNKNGRWLVLDGKNIYMFDPPTQMQKDTWLIEGRRLSKQEHERRLKMLRWFCYSCNNIQEP